MMASNNILDLESEQNETLDPALTFSLRKIGAQFSASQLKRGQQRAISEFVAQKDSLVILPTGHGKSMIYQCAPFINDFNKHASVCGCHSEEHVDFSSIAIVISPLIALMKDQVGVLRHQGVNAVYMADALDNREKKDLVEGKFSLVFTSPEGILGDRGTTLLSSSVYRNNICGIFVDEGHCIAKWGYKSGKVSAFRSMYSRLAELRSFLRSSTPLFALTATASPTVKKTIIDSLGLSDFSLIEESPERDNIRYSVITTNGNELAKDLQFEWLKKELCEKKHSTEKVLIFCKTHRNSRSLHAFLTENLDSDEEGMVANFCGVTEESHKKKFLSDFVKENSTIRILLATSAFGMGINVKGLHTVVNYGASRDVDDYFQESGRVGRDGQKSHAVLFNYRGNFGKGKTDENMKNYVDNKDNKCRREMLLSHYNYKSMSTIIKHDCCDVCSAICVCEESECIPGKGMSTFEKNMREQLVKLDNCEKKVYRDIDDAARITIRDLLYVYRESLASAMPSESLYSGVDIATGFSVSLIQNVVDNCEYIGSLEQLATYPFFHQDHVKKVWNILEQIGGEVSIGIEKDSDDSDKESDVELDVFATLSDFDDDVDGLENFISDQFSRIILPISDEEDS